MSLISIGGVTLPVPSEFSVQIADISKAERNASGTMVIERITTKRKLEIGYRYLSRTDMASVLTALNPVTFSVTYMDPQTNANRTATFYCGDRSVGMLDFVSSVPRYKDVKFNLIEK